MNAFQKFKNQYQQSPLLNTDNVSNVNITS